MGQHTWFYKDKELYGKTTLLYDKLNKHEAFEIYLEDIEIDQINYEIDEIRKLNDTVYHDAFRTSKREADDGTYTLDVIYSKKDCDKWLIDNAETVYYINKEYLDKFWDEYPDGVIDFE